LSSSLLVVKQSRRFYDSSSRDPKSFEERQVPIPQLIVYEKTGKWASALRRELDQRFVDRLFETRLLGHCEEQVNAHPCSITAIEQTWNNYDSVLLLLDRIHREIPTARTIVLDNTRDSQIVCMNQVAGAIHVTDSKLRLRHAARLIQRHFARFPATSSQFEELVRRLPWGDGQ
jgi:hypothetical protein